jgi:holo-[acyl-carrier protein] synthase
VLVGIGIDLVERSRVAAALARWGNRLVERLMGDAEADALPKPKSERADAIAYAVALKEAASKALGTGWSHGVFWRHVVVAPGPPALVRLEEGAAKVAAHFHVQDVEACLTVQGDLVIAEVWLWR